VKLRDLGEFGLIDRIAAGVKPDRSVVIGIGDDAAALAPTPGCLSLVTSDMLLEGVHFDLSFSDPYTLGKKTVAVNLSDLAAMGAKPRHFLLSLAIPPALPVQFLEAFIAGLLERAGQFGVTLVGGDTCSSKSGLVMSVTAMGEQLPELVVSRSGARAGDLLFVTGTLGDSALGLALLQAGERRGQGIARHLDPEPRVTAGVALAEAGLATAMIDVSDGLLADLGHIMELSGVGARLELANIPRSPGYNERIPQIADDPYSLALGGGEDYELLFTASPAKKAEVLALFARIGLQVSPIGEINAGGRLTIIAADGTDYQPVSRGYNHFS
jgi:thiamine-monophosphate kinase